MYSSLSKDLKGIYLLLNGRVRSGGVPSIIVVDGNFFNTGFLDTSFRNDRRIVVVVIH